MSLLVAKDLKLRRGARAIFDGLSFALDAGERVALIGQNGAGKSTLFDVLLGVLRADSGTVELRGRPLDQVQRREVASTIAIVPQLEQLPEDLAVLDAVLMGRAPHQRGFSLASEEDIELSREYMQQVDLDGFEERELGTLSGGERQRVLIARALVQKPQLLLLDEPTSSLDLRHALGVIRIVKQMAEQKVAVLAAVHDLNQAPLFAQRALIMHQGKIAIDDTVDRALDPERLEPILNVHLVRGEVAGKTVLVPG